MHRSLLSAVLSLSVLLSSLVAVCIVVLMLVGSAGAEVINRKIGLGAATGLVQPAPSCLPDFGLGGWLIIDHDGFMRSVINTEKGEMRISSNFRTDVAWDPQDENQFSPDLAQVTHEGRTHVQFSDRRPLEDHAVPISLTVSLMDLSGITSTITIPLILNFFENGGLSVQMTFAPACL